MVERQSEAEFFTELNEDRQKCIKALLTKLMETPEEELHTPGKQRDVAYSVRKEVADEIGCSTSLVNSVLDENPDILLYRSARFQHDFSDGCHPKVFIDDDVIDDADVTVTETGFSFAGADSPPVEQDSGNDLPDKGPDKMELSFEGDSDDAENRSSVAESTDPHDDSSDDIIGDVSVDEADESLIGIPEEEGTWNEDNPDDESSTSDVQIGMVGETESEDEFPARSQREIESFESLSRERQEIVDALIAAMQYVTEQGQSNTLKKELVHEASHLTSGTYTRVNGVLVENSDILSARAGVGIEDWVDDPEEYSPETLPDDLRISNDKVTERKETYSSRPFETGMEYPLSETDDEIRTLMDAVGSEDSESEDDHSDDEQIGMIGIPDESEDDHSDDEQIGMIGIPDESEDDHSDALLGDNESADDSDEEATDEDPIGDVTIGEPLGNQPDYETVDEAPSEDIDPEEELETVSMGDIGENTAPEDDIELGEVGVPDDKELEDEHTTDELFGSAQRENESEDSEHAADAVEDHSVTGPRPESVESNRNDEPGLESTSVQGGQTESAISIECSVKRESTVKTLSLYAFTTLVSFFATLAYIAKQKFN